jgi:hypothetical protein
MEIAMLGTKGKFFRNFPELISTGEVELYSGQMGRSYTIDWSTKENKDIELYEHGTLPHLKDLDYDIDHAYSFIPFLPEEYYEWLRSIKFAISKDFYREIKRHSRLAIDQWSHVNNANHSNGYTNDICLKPAMAHVESAFRLLADSAYSEDRKSYERYGKNVILAPAMTYHFWGNVLDQKSVWNVSGLNRINSSYRYKNPHAVQETHKDEEGRSSMIEFLEDVKEREKNRRHFYQSLYDNIADKIISIGSVNNGIVPETISEALTLAIGQFEKEDLSYIIDLAKISPSVIDIQKEFRQARHVLLEYRNDKKGLENIQTVMRKTGSR